MTRVPAFPRHDFEHVKVRDGGHVRSKALVLAYAVHESSRRDQAGAEGG